MSQPTPRFEDLVSQLVERIRRGPAGGFVPHRPPANTSDRRRPRTRCEAGRGLTSYRDVYSCPSSTWGADDGWTPPVTSDAAAAMQRNALPTPRRKTTPSSGTMPLRLFDQY